ncbi:MAG: hypothetical protein ACQXXF_01060 [Thermoplasmatota archaeon]|jgi:hypothetical protein
MPNIGNNKKYSKKFLSGIAIFVIAILILSSIYIYFEYYSKEEIQEKKEEPKIIDDRISPLENQAVIIEVLRIRHRGLYDKLKTIGNSWKEKPRFYFVVNMDGLEYSSKKVEQHGRGTEIVFNTWDTWFQENKIIKDAEEEQETSKITLTIVEQVKYGLLKRKTKDVERDSITVTYDYKTGRWSGDDYFKDKDGYGHYLGKTFEIWFNIYQTDYDDDNIPYWTEVNILGTDPTRDDSKLDPDGDGIPTAWEWKWGYDPFTWDDHEKLDPDLDGLENIEEYKMSKWFADPFIQDIYYEVDIMGKGGFLDPPHYFYEESQQAIIEKFAEHNIRLYFDTGWPNGPKNGGGQILPHIKMVSQDSGMVLQFYNNYFPPERRGIFRYLIIGHGGGFQHPSIGNVYDTTLVAYMSGRKYRPVQAIKEFFMYGIWPTPRGQRISLAGTIMHEMGHSIGIDASMIEGCDNISYFNPIFPKKKYVETWGQYVSVMNYLYTHNPKVLDYSHGLNGPPYDQNDWLRIFAGEFQYNSILVEEPFFSPPVPPEKLVVSEQKITGYVYDENLTVEFTKYIKDFSPVDPIKVDWRVYKLVDKENHPNYRNVKVLAQPRNTSAARANIWIHYCEGDLESDGNMHFYSFDEILKEKTS